MLKILKFSLYCRRQNVLIPFLQRIFHTNSIDLGKRKPKICRELDPKNDSVVNPCHGVVPDNPPRCTKCIVGCVVRPIYRIERATCDDEERIIQHLRENFFQDDPVATALGMRGANGYVERIILHKMREGVTIIATSTCPKRRLLGVVIGSHFCPEEPDITYKLSHSVPDARIRKLLQFVAYIKQEPAVHLKLDTVKIFDICLLSVDTQARWHGIGTMLVKQAFIAGRNLGHRYVRFDTTSLYARKIAKKLDLPILWSMKYSDFINIYGDPMFKAVGRNLGIKVHVENTRVTKMWQIERDIEEFEAKCRRLLPDY